MDVFFPVSTKLDIDELIKHYVKIRPMFKYNDICSIINHYHRKKLTLQHLKTKLKKLRLQRKRSAFEKDLMVIISNELGMPLAKILVMDKFLSLFPLIMVPT